MIFSVYGDDGIVRQVITLPQGMDYIPADGEYAVEGESTPGIDKVINGELVRAPVQPSHLHSFNQESFSWEIDIARLEQDILKKRQNLLASSDWTQLPDVPLSTKEYWATYRQCLRDITNQPGFPLNVIWPIPPI